MSGLPVQNRGPAETMRISRWIMAPGMVSLDGNLYDTSTSAFRQTSQGCMLLTEVAVWGRTNAPLAQQTKPLPFDPERTAEVGESSARGIVIVRSTLLLQNISPPRKHFQSNLWVHCCLHPRPVHCTATPDPPGTAHHLIGTARHDVMSSILATGEGGTKHGVAESNRGSRMMDEKPKRASCT